MQLSVFSTDNQKSGFRLQYMEVYNWGTFDDHVHAIRPLGETSLLTGANGSGKTTFVDALLTLIVPEKKYRFYNQSSGSEKKGDRTEESYVLGGYGTINSENGSTTKTLYLRENKEEAYSILLAAFANEAGQEVTLFQVRYFGAGEMKKVFAIAHTLLHIEEDFTPFDLSGGWKRRMEVQYNRTGGKPKIEWFDAASKYAARLTDVLGMQSLQALSLFNQTVGIKVLGNLDEFIRTHMLEPRNMEEQFLELKKHLNTLLDAQRNIEKAEEQIALLKILELHYQTYAAYKQQLDVSQKELDIAAIWNGYTKNQLLHTAIDEAELSLREVQSKLTAVKESIAELAEKERTTRNQIEQNKAGQRLKELEQELKSLNDKLQQVQSNYIKFSEWCTTLHLEETIAADEAAYKRIIGEARRTKHRIEREQRLNEEDDFEAKNVLRKATEEKDDVERELNALLQSKNNIPSHLVNLRREICTELKIDISELPFAGELMQVRHDELHWEAALEKLLHGFSLRLLIPEKYYKKVNRYVNNTNLRSRLVYYQVFDDVLLPYADEGTVYDKLEFHPEHRLSEWVQQQIIQSFDYICLDDEAELDRYDRAITINGLVKNRDRHEKDDRPDRNDPGRYVMGWNNEKKKAKYLTKRDVLLETIRQSNETIERCKRKAARLQAQSYAILKIEEHEGFALLDATSMQQSIHSVQQQMDGLRESNDQLKTLTQQLDAIQQQISLKDEERTALIREESLTTNQSQLWQQQQQHLQPLLQLIKEEDKDALLQFQQQYASAFATLTLQTIDDTYNELRSAISKKVSELRDSLHKEEGALQKSISRIKSPSITTQQRFPDWNGDVHHLPDDPAFAEEYIEWLAKLENENLPKYKKDFDNYINITITYKIGGLNEEMEKWEREIKNSIHKLNSSLAGINFNRLPDTFIQLGIRNVMDGTIKEFRSKLLEALPQAANWQQSSFEEKSAHFRDKVQPLVASLDESESYRARVLDVRNWFEFWADEIYRNTNELKKTYRQMGQLSGGEKAQLTYTILCSAIAYQFGITKEGKNSKSLRFIAVDESFSNQDEEKATYLMELCKQLHLQLLVVTPSDKIQIVQEFIAHVHLVQRVANRHSVLYNMTVKELREKMEEATVLN